MPDSVLLIDMGNSRIKWVWAVDGRIDEKTSGRGGLDDFRRFTQSHAGGSPGRVLLSSVAAKERTKAVMDACDSHWAVAVSPLLSPRQQAGIRNAYEQAETLGVDRWLAIVGAAHSYGKPVVIWDIGTATTLDAVDAAGQHLGGYIFPGPATMLEALRSGTALTVPGGLSGALEDSPTGQEYSISRENHRGLHHPRSKGHPGRRAQPVPPLYLPASWKPHAGSYRRGSTRTTIRVEIQAHT